MLCSHSLQAIFRDILKFAIQPVPALKATVPRDVKVGRDFRRLLRDLRLEHEGHGTVKFPQASFRGSRSPFDGHFLFFQAASGWFSGLAASKAGRARQRASISVKRRNEVKSQSQRCAL